MSLPPEQITLRRKRGAEALDTLYIENEGQQGKRHRSAAQSGFFYARVNSRYDSRAQGNRPTHTPLPRVPPPQVPVVRTTLAGEDEDAGPAKAVQNLPSQAPFPDGPRFHGLELNGETKKRGLHPQAFRLARPASTNPLRSSVTKGGIHKPKKKRKGEIPLFVERTMLMIEAAQSDPPNPASPLKHSPEKEPRAGSVSAEYPPPTPPPQKRPIVTAAEKEWRARNWTNVQASRHGKEGAAEGGGGKTKQKRPPVQRTIPLVDDPIDLAAQLSEFAQLEAQKLHRTPAKQQQQPHATEDARIGVPTPKSHLKFPPKSPPARSSRTHPQQQQQQQPDSDMTDVGAEEGDHHHPRIRENDDDDQDYVYETFVRRPITLVPPGSDSPQSSPKHGTHGENAGVLVIASEDEELWQAYGEDEDGEREFPSDEDDENAEDYYGNDYPEDEVESDDEYGRAAYRYRRGGSDNEDYAAAEGAAWSDDEDKSRRWR